MSSVPGCFGGPCFGDDALCPAPWVCCSVGEDCWNAGCLGCVAACTQNSDCPTGNCSFGHCYAQEVVPCPPGATNACNAGTAGEGICQNGVCVPIAGPPGVLPPPGLSPLAQAALGFGAIALLGGLAYVASKNP